MTDQDEGRGCLLIVGIVACSIASASIWGGAVGWLVLGCTCLGAVVLEFVGNVVIRARRK